MCYVCYLVIVCFRIPQSFCRDGKFYFDSLFGVVASQKFAIKSVLLRFFGSRLGNFWREVNKKIVEFANFSS